MYIKQIVSFHFSCLNMVLHFSTACLIVFQKSSHFNKDWSIVLSLWHLEHTNKLQFPWSAVTIIICNELLQECLPIQALSAGAGAQLWPVCDRGSGCCVGLWEGSSQSPPAAGAECKLRTCTLLQERVVGKVEACHKPHTDLDPVFTFLSSPWSWTVMES